MSVATAETLRTFLAVEPSEASRREAMGVTRALRDAPHGNDVRWVRPESLHVTLHFLGDIGQDDVAPVASQVAAQLRDIAAFEARLGALSAFPSPRRARVVVLDVEPAAPLIELAGAVGRGVLAAGLLVEERAFRPHLTLGRVRRGRRAPSLEAAHSSPTARFSVREVVLFRSRLAQGGATYHALERMSLGAGDHPTNPIDSNDPN